MKSTRLGRRPVLLAFALAPTLSACSSSDSGAAPPPPVPAFASATSGSRLHATYADAGGGARLETGLFDTMLGVACEPALAADNVTRCVPAAGGQQVFTDPQCTKAAVLLPPCGTPPPYVRVTTDNTAPGACATEGPSFVYAVGQQVPKTYSNTGGTSCVPSDVPVTSGLAYELGAEVPAASLVKVTSTEKVPRGASLEAETMVFEDGTRLGTGTYFMTMFSETPCTFQSSSDGTTTTCVPSSIVYLEGATGQGPFADAACTQPAVPISTGGAMPCPNASAPTFAEESMSDANGCMVKQYFSLTGAVSMVYDSYGNGTCNAYPSNGQVYAGVGPSVDPSTFPTATVSYVGTGPVQAVIATLSDGTVVGENGFVLAASKIPCKSESVGSTELCSTAEQFQSGYPGVFYADPTCTQLIATVHASGMTTPNTCPTGNPGAPPTTPPPYLEPYVAGECQPGLVYPVETTPIQPTVLFARQSPTGTSSICQETPVAATLIYFATGAGVDASTVFPAIATGVD